MSRSYKHNSFVTDSHGKNIRRRFMKRYSNKSIRNKLNNSDELMQRSSYKKHFESYDICDYRYLWTEEDAIKTYHERLRSEWFVKKYPTLESWLHYYRKRVVYK